MIIVLSTSSKNLNIEVFPTVKYETHCELFGFPDADYNTDMMPIFHIVKLVASLDTINDESEVTEEVEDILKECYWIDEEENQLVLAKMTMTEFPNSWREQMEVTWSYWLDAIDGDHLVVGSRADEILDRDLYDNPFDNGSLYYIHDLDVHDSFKNNGIEINLIRYTFSNFILNYVGMVFFIAQKIDKDIEKDSTNKITRVVKDKEMLDIFERGGFSRLFNSVVNDLVLEIEVHKLQDL